ncbi:hypothetical protein T10_10403 [Trichinella papuae]|uniref:Uncharacterized protein n=1 Tax=Trichinella papuae TaxID=268474 RepID=A0A0V1M4Z6_9BILA|nr:hypothetical protein T10_10403 [Trichinella papuae]
MEDCCKKQVAYGVDVTLMNGILQLTHHERNAESAWSFHFNSQSLACFITFIHLFRVKQPISHVTYDRWKRVSR